MDEHFGDRLNPVWEVSEIGTGEVAPAPGALRLTIRRARDRYSNAQIADYRYADFNFRWRPPLRLTVTAWVDCSADAIGGTAGFGFWNHPFSPDSRRLPRPPQAIWFFFAGARSDMALAYGVPGCGWKAATIDAARVGALALVPLALPAAVLMRIPRLYARLYPAVQRRLHIGESILDSRLLEARHTYALDWRRDGAAFAVDGETVLETPFAPRGAAGFVAWIDNQYAVVTPQGRLGFGVVPVERDQSLVIERITIEHMDV
ncbi:MAG: hypothetical protein IT319_04650 [Anaerolineae bacterium]|nr:hypothetical protein [Anaerolineae bacterium]